MDGQITWLLIFLVLAQRISELIISRRNELKLMQAGAKELDRNGYRLLIGMHVAFFISMILEVTILKKGLNGWWIFLVLIFLAAQVLRYGAMASLGIYWNTKILVAPNHPIIRKGPYKLLRHPNYIAVVMELAVIPLMFSCYITSVVFTLLNAIMMSRRMRIETAALSHFPQ